MSYDLSKLLVIGVSSSALFDLREEDRIFREQKLPAFIRYQQAHEDVILRPGAAFPLIRGLLALNDTLAQPRFEVILMSRNHPDVSLRVFNSIDHHNLGISRAALTGGAPLGPYLAPFEVGLFLSQNRDDVQSAANQCVAAGLIYSPPPQSQIPAGQIRIAFDGDCVIFSDEAQRIYDEHHDLQEFYEYERRNAKKELPAGPFAKLLRTLSEIQGPDPDHSPIRIALVTTRNMPAHERVIRTLRAWNIRIDEAFFLGGIVKAEIIKAFGAHMFFDEEEENCTRAAEAVPTGRVLVPIAARPAVIEPEIQINVRVETQDAVGEKRFLTICETFLKGEFQASETGLRGWYGQIRDWPDANLSAFLNELEESVKGTPQGSQRRAVGKDDSASQKLLAFLDELASKYRRG